MGHLSFLNLKKTFHSSSTGKPNKILQLKSGKLKTMIMICLHSFIVVHFQIKYL